MRQILTWDDTFMNLAHTIALARSKDPNTQVGCVLVRDRDPIAFGYNGFIPGVDETPEMWERPHKYDHVIHAETNAVGRAARRGLSTIGATCYVTAFPCLPCAKLLIAAGIIEVHAHKMLAGWDESTEKAAAEFDRAGVIYGVWND